jgi:hypothetical protein
LETTGLGYFQLKNSLNEDFYLQSWSILDISPVLYELQELVEGFLQEPQGLS